MPSYVEKRVEKESRAVALSLRFGTVYFLNALGFTVFCSFVRAYLFGFCLPSRRGAIIVRYELLCFHCWRAGCHGLWPKEMWTA